MNGPETLKSIQVKHTETTDSIEFSPAYKSALDSYNPPVVHISLDEIQEEGVSPVQRFIESLGDEGAESSIVVMNVRNKEDWEKLHDLYTIKNALAVASQFGVEGEQLVQSLDVVLNNRELSERIAQNLGVLPYLVVEANENVLESYRQVGGIDTVIPEGTDMERTLTAAKSALFARSKGPDRLHGRHIAESLERIAQYVDLLKLEPKSTDTPATLRTLREAIATHEEETGLKIKRLLEAGVGEGRVAILLHLLGYEVTGIDMSEDRMDRAYQRMYEQALEFVQENPPREGSLARMVWDQLDPGQLDAVRSQLRQRLQETQSYHGFEEWQQARLFAKDSFHLIPGMVQNMSGVEQQILGQEVQAAVFAWNTFNFMGGPDQMVYALQRMYDVLPPQGMLYLEVPDPESGVYPAMLQSYYNSHPDAIYGMVESKPNTEGELYKDDKQKPGAVRYFPTVDELGAYLELAGFTVKQVKRHTIGSGEQEGFDSMTIVAYRNE